MRRTWDQLYTDRGYKLHLRWCQSLFFRTPSKRRFHLLSLRLSFGALSVSACVRLLGQNQLCPTTAAPDEKNPFEGVMGGVFISRFLGVLVFNHLTTSQSYAERVCTEHMALIMPGPSARYFWTAAWRFYVVPRSLKRSLCVVQLGE